MHIEIVSESGLSEYSLKKLFAFGRTKAEERDLAIIYTQDKA